MADISAAEVTEVGPDRVRLSGVRGHPRPDTLKALAYFDGGWLGEAEISYAGPNAEARARLAMDVVRQRMGPNAEVRFDLIGVASILNDDAARRWRRRPRRRSATCACARRSPCEREGNRPPSARGVFALAGGSGGGGGVRTNKRQRLSNVTCLVPRAHVPARFEFVEGT